MPHIHKLIDFTVGGFIVHNKKVLLVHHKKLGLWLPVGGHIELNEDMDEALFREIEEESGLRRSQLAVLSKRPTRSDGRTKFLYTPNYVDIHRIDRTHRHIGLGYFLRSKTDKVVLAKKEHYAIRWFSRLDLNNRKYSITPATRFYCREAIKTASKR